MVITRRPFSFRMASTFIAGLLEQDRAGRREYGARGYLYYIGPSDAG